MAISKRDQTQIREYLLGKLSEDEQQRIEERLVVEDELFDEFEVSKDELVEEYCAGDLAQSERQWLEENLLATPEGKERYAFVLAMDCLQRKRLNSAPDVLPDAVPQKVVRPRFRGKLAFLGPLQIFAKTQPWALAATSLVVLLLVAFVITRWASQAPGQVFEATLARSTVVRGEGLAPTKLKLPSNTGELKLSLQLPKPATPDTRYKAQLDDRVSTKDVEIIETNVQSVTVVVPAKLVPRGEYSLVLTIANPNNIQQRLSYLFNVE
jgi:anti-sigma factor RsiW